MLETTKHHEHLSSGPTSFAARWIVKYVLIDSHSLLLTP